MNGMAMLSYVNERVSCICFVLARCRGRRYEADMTTPRHPFDGIRIPQTMLRVLDLLSPYEPWATASHLSTKLGFLCDLDTDVIHSRFELAVPRDAMRATPELRYARTPFETVPVSWDGGDGLHFDWVVHAPELDEDDFPMVSFSHVDENGAAWLGDDTAEGLANLLVAHHSGWAQYTPDDLDPSLDPLWRTLVDAIGREPDLASAHILEGGRSERTLVPRVPNGYRFEPGSDGIGVLARADAFGDVDVASPPSPAIATLDDARRLFDAGAFAGALVRLKQLRGLRRRADEPTVVEHMAACYDGLGRTMHARRARRWLELKSHST